MLPLGEAVVPEVSRSSQWRGDAAGLILLSLLLLLLLLLSQESSKRSARWEPGQGREKLMWPDQKKQVGRWRWRRWVSKPGEEKARGWLARFLALPSTASR